MNGRIIYLVILISVLLLPGCQYRKGKSFTWSETGDSVKYIIATSGYGKRVVKKVNRLVSIHEIKRDECRVIYVSDSACVGQTKSILLFNSVLPDLRKDMLSKGFIGTFGTRQKIIYLVVSAGDFKKYFTPTD